MLRSEISDLPPGNPQDELEEPYRRPFATFRSIGALIMREMSTTYGRSPGGYIWAVLEPVGWITVMSLAFSMAIHSPPLGTNFIYFYASGYLVFSAYNDMANRTMQAVRYSRQLLAYPAVTYIDAIFARFLLAATTQALVITVITTGVITIFDLQVILRPTWMLLSYLMAATLAIGVGTLNCVLASLFPLWERLWGVITRPLFLISGIFYTFDSLGSQIQAYLWFNPLVHVVGAMRAGFFIVYDPGYVEPAYVLGVGLTCLTLGLVFMNRYHRQIINNR